MFWVVNIRHVCQATARLFASHLLHTISSSSCLGHRCQKAISGFDKDWIKPTEEEKSVWWWIASLKTSVQIYTYLILVYHSLSFWCLSPPSQYILAIFLAAPTLPTNPINKAHKSQCSPEESAKSWDKSRNQQIVRPNDHLYWAIGSAIVDLVAFCINMR